jgi:PTS system fructose-specific IIA component/PTS system nitrogen regulatory IIA component
MRLIDFVVPEAVIPDMKARTKDEAIQEIVDTLVAAGITEECDSPRFVRNIHRREELGSTGLGRGLAMPEVGGAYMRRTCLVILRSHVGIDWQSLDDKNVDLFFAITKVTADPAEHINMACLCSHALRSDDFCERLRQARNREEILAVIAADTTEYPRPTESHNSPGH